MPPPMPPAPSIDDEGCFVNDVVFRATSFDNFVIVSPDRFLLGGGAGGGNRIASPN